MEIIVVLIERNNEHFISTLTLTAIANCIPRIEHLNGTNFASWKDQIKISLGITDLDYALRFDQPAPLTDETTVEQKKTYDIWERSNRMSLMIMKNSISPAIRGAIPDSENAKEFLEFVEEQFKGSSKSHASTLILKMLTTKYDGVSGVREHIMMMNDMASKLKGMDMEISEGFLVHFIMTSLPSQFGPFKINYNTQKEKWKMSELIAMCVQEEERLKIEKPGVAHLTTAKTTRKKVFKNNKGSKWEKGSSANESSLKASASKGKETGPKCKFCKKHGHIQRECPKFREWLDKKGIPFKEDVYFDSHVVGTSSLENDLYKLHLDNNFAESLLTMDVHVITNGKRKKLENENSPKLWHKRLGHISKDRMQRLTKEGILPTLDFSNYNQCIECVKGKFVKTNKKGSTRSKELLEIIHTDICGPFITDIGGHKFLSLSLMTILAEVENQLKCKIKIVRSDRGGEYYGKHSDVGQSPGPFALFCREHGIINQFTMPGTPQQNGVAERRYRFYCPNHTTRIVESRNVEFIENGENSESGGRNIELEESVNTHKSDIPLSPNMITTPSLAQNEDENHEPDTQQPLRKSVNYDDFVVYLNEIDYDLSKVEDHTSYKEAITSNQSTQWLEARHDELKSMEKNDVWELTELPNGAKPVRCKWVYKTKLDQKGNIERYKARLVAKGYTQKE
ncbi:uncharacterized protein [Rutidosis leptorrhynchoides]|uniref:uncharacterized protein n=1 Tax=Rutidosis leptorrhynchoides TaxID=125765 RepID=UPI003A9A445F